MAQRRMFSLQIIDTDAFLEMPTSARELYFQLGMRADDDGFVNNPRKITRMLGASEDDLRILMAKRFIINFESGVVVIKHWKINNYIQSDRYTPTKYFEEKKQIEIKENGAYTEKAKLNESMYTQRIQESDTVDTQVRLGKVSIGKEREEASVNYLKTIPDVDLEEFYKQFECSKKGIRDKGASLYDYCKGHGKVYKDYKAMLSNALRKDFGTRKPAERFIPPVDDYIPASPEKVAEVRAMRDKLAGKMSIKN